MEMSSVAKGWESTAKRRENELLLFLRNPRGPKTFLRENAYKPLISPTYTH